MNIGEILSLWLLVGVIISLGMHIITDGFSTMPGDHSELSYIISIIFVWPVVAAGIFYGIYKSRKHNG